MVIVYRSNTGFTKAYAEMLGRAEQMKVCPLAEAQGKTVEDIKAIIAGLHEFNPMMGHRGCRLAVTYPEITVMQTKAVSRPPWPFRPATPTGTWSPRS